MDEKQQRAVRLMARIIMNRSRSDVIDEAILDGALVFMMHEIYPNKSAAVRRELLDFALATFPLVMTDERGAPVEDPAPGCPGATSYGHGANLTTVHAGGCCERWKATQEGKGGTA